jgi:hypothetical protein
MKHFLLIALLVASTFSVRAQSVWGKHSFYLKVTPTSLLDGYGNRLPIGIDYHFSKRWATAFEWSLPLKHYYRHLTSVDPRYQRLTFDLRFRGDIKYFISKNHKAYVGVEGFWRNQEMSVETRGSFVTEANEYGGQKGYFYNKGSIFKNIFGGGLILGTYGKITRRIFLEPYCGIGFRHLAEHRLNIEGLQSEG